MLHFMTATDLADFYRDYIHCLNAQDWARLGDFVHEDVRRNGIRLGLAGYREMLEADFAQIPDLRFVIDFLVSEPPRIASRLVFDCTPKSMFMGLPVNGRRIVFAENVFYALVDQRIGDVWSVIDKTSIEGQL
jgi:predicted ester cyclase